MKTTVELDASNRIVLSTELRRAMTVKTSERLRLGHARNGVTPYTNIKRANHKGLDGAVRPPLIEEVFDQSCHQ
jgi:hypothetical protein